MKELFLIGIFFSWINFVHAEWSLIDDFEIERNIAYFAGNFHGTPEGGYFADPSGSNSQVLHSGGYDRFGILNAGWALGQENQFKPEDIGTVYIRYYSTINDVNIITSFGFYHIEIGIGEGMSLPLLKLEVG